jgi:TolB-like protein
MITRAPQRFHLSSTAAQEPLSGSTARLPRRWHDRGFNHRLASRAGVRVIALQSVMQYRDAGKRAPTIAKELGVNALVEVSVQQSGRRIRVDIRLIDGATSRSLWATAFVGDLGDTLALQADISKAIVSELHLALDPSQG